MAQRADGESLRKFLKDRELLPYNDAEIARRMEMDRSNFSSYVNGHLPITRSFLRRFYTAFGEELQVIREKLKPMEAEEETGLVERLDEMERRVREMEEGVREDRVGLRRVEERMEEDYDPRLGAVEEMLNQLIEKFRRFKE